jgi:hypothetical protein
VLLITQSNVSCWTVQVHGGRSGIEGPGLSQQQKVAYAVGFLALPYLWSRLNRHAAHQEWGQRPGVAGVMVV